LLKDSGKGLYGCFLCNYRFGVDGGRTNSKDLDDYNYNGKSIDRFAEAFAEYLHEKIRKKFGVTPQMKS
jgi:5-methyltetrahydrofolate--homocysteine methyltransferase